jgi:hypothetical protein
MDASRTATLKELGEHGALPGFRNAATAPPRVLISAVGLPKFRAACVEHVLQATLEEAMAPVQASAFKGARAPHAGAGPCRLCRLTVACQPRCADPPRGGRLGEDRDGAGRHGRRLRGPGLRAQGAAGGGD